MSVWLEVLGSVLLFCLVLGMSATVDINDVRTQMKNAKAIIPGLGMQFIVLPLLGFLSVKIFKLDHPTSIALLVVTSSPGGSYSNWWCSMFNADLALSVTMTAISTLLSCVMLPLNLLIYTRHTYNDDVVDVLDWGSLICAILVVIAGIGCGLLASAKFGSSDFKLLANRLGNLAGVFLIIFSCIMSNTDKNARIWNRDAAFYFAISLPCLIGLCLSTALTSFLKLWKPERIAVSIECCYQNVGIATSVALSMFQGEDLALAIAVPFFYGIMECIFLCFYCIWAWKAGWTKAPANVSFFHMLFTTYEVIKTESDHTGEAEDYYIIEAPSDSKQQQVEQPAPTQVVL